MSNDVKIFFVSEIQEYPSIPPYNPSFRYPEYPFGDVGSDNQVYESIRRLLFNAKYDIKNYGNNTWNPLGIFIKPGDKVLIKPNWVRDFNPIDKDISSLITHSSVLRAILDYVIIALKEDGEIVIGDAPIQSCDFNNLLKRSHIDNVVNFLSKKTNVKIHIKDFRNQVMKMMKLGTFERYENNLNKYYEINLGKNSFLKEIAKDYKKFRVTSYDKDKMFLNHNETDHKYLIIDDVFNSDVIIEVPKLKTHHKAGITCCLKNNVGINVSKDYLVHHRKGSIFECGDAYNGRSALKKAKENIEEIYDKTSNKFLQLFIKIILKIVKIFLIRYKDTTYEGSWYGNDTIWRMILDLNMILFNYHSIEKGIDKSYKRKVFYIIDGVIGGEKESPLTPSPVKLGLLGFGFNPVIIDIMCSRLIGFDYKKIPSLKKALDNNFLEINEDILEQQIIWINNKIKKFRELEPLKYFIPPKGWINHIELRQ